MRSRFLVLADPPDATIAEWVEVVRDPQDAPIVAACVWHQITHLVTGDKETYWKIRRSLRDLRSMGSMS